MELSTAKDLIATSASFCTLTLFLAGIMVCRKFIENKSTGEASCLPFITCFMSCSLWLRYGQLIGDQHVIFVNAFGSVLQIMYTFVYLSYTTKRTATIRQSLGAIFFVVLIYIYSIMIKETTSAIKVIGFLSCSLTIMFFASPLIMLAHVIRVRNTDSLPFPIILMTFIASCQWLTYGVLLGDSFIQFPNFLGCLLSSFQLALFMVYRKKKSDQVSLI